jgi:Trypsin-co-occurring domain 1
MIDAACGPERGSIVLESGAATPKPNRSRIARTKLADGTTFLVELADTGRSQELEVSGAPVNFENALLAVRNISTKLVDAVKAAAPTKFSVELGFDFDMEPGQLTAFLVKGKAGASITVTLEWENAKG